MGEVLWLANFRNVPEIDDNSNEPTGTAPTRATENQRAQATNFSLLLAEHAEAVSQEIAALRAQPDAQSQNRRTYLFTELKEITRLTGALGSRWDAAADLSFDIDDAPDDAELPLEG